MKVWCIEDDENINNLVTYAMKSAGYEARGFFDCSGFFLRLNDDRPDILILDVMLPDTDGLEILKSLRKSRDTQKLPVIMLTAKTAEIDKVRALDAGADDYVTKPFGVMELISRVNAVLRRASPARRQDTVTCGNVTIDDKRHTVLSCGSPVELTLKEYNLLRLLMTNPGQVFTRRQLMDRVWGDSYVGESRTIDMHVKTLRQKLGDGGRIIKTIRGVGYKAQ